MNRGFLMIIQGGLGYNLFKYSNTNRSMESSRTFKYWMAENYFRIEGYLKGKCRKTGGKVVWVPKCMCI